MRTKRYVIWVCLGLAQAAGTLVNAQLKNPPIPHASGQSVTPSFEGWYPNPDGTFTLSFGYMNRNFEEIVDIPVGPNNKIEPGPPDQGQPTHFLPRRHTGVFTVVVPKDFGNQKVTWTLNRNAERISIPGHLRPEWMIDALKEVTSNNTPPVLKFDPAGKAGQGPSGTRTTQTVTLPAAATLNVWVTDDGVRKAGEASSNRPALGVIWSKYRGPGDVTFTDAEPSLDERGKAVTKAAFSQPGDYVLRALAWDSSGRPGFVMAGGFQCCWTNGYVNVTVKPAGSVAEGR